MDDKKYNVGEQVANINENPAKNTGKKRDPLGSKNAQILEFITKLELHECDAVKVALRVVKSGTKVSDITRQDADILNEFMNEGLKPGANNTVETVMSHRQLKAYRLAMTTGDFLEKKEKITVMSGALMLFASIYTYVTEVVNKLNPPASQSDSNSSDNAKADVKQDGSNSANNVQTAPQPNGSPSADRVQTSSPQGQNPVAKQ